MVKIQFILLTDSVFITLYIYVVLTIDGDGTVKVATDKQDGFGVCQKDLGNTLYTIIEIFLCEINRKFL